MSTAPSLRNPVLENHSQQHQPATVVLSVLQAIPQMWLPHDPQKGSLYFEAWGAFIASLIVLTAKWISIPTAFTKKQFII